ncbi:MAG: hypothetical protein QW727_03275, partial [Candidatus Pacearchaeota archaeon]
ELRLKCCEAGREMSSLFHKIFRGYILDDDKYKCSQDTELTNGEIKGYNFVLEKFKEYMLQRGN